MHEILNLTPAHPVCDPVFGGGGKGEHQTPPRKGHKTKRRVQTVLWTMLFPQRHRSGACLLYETKPKEHTHALLNLEDMKLNKNNFLTPTTQAKKKIKSTKSVTR